MRAKMTPKATHRSVNKNIAVWVATGPIFVEFGCPVWLQGGGPRSQFSSPKRLFLALGRLGAPRGAQTPPTGLQDLIFEPPGTPQTLIFDDF